MHCVIFDFVFFDGEKSTEADVEGELEPARTRLSARNAQFELSE